MNVIEETIEATLDANGQLRLTHPAAAAAWPRARNDPRRHGGWATARHGGRDPGDRRRPALRGFHGRTAAELQAEEERAWPRTTSGTGNWTPLAQGPRRGAVSAVLPGHRDRHLRR